MYSVAKKGKYVLKMWNLIFQEKFDQIHSISGFEYADNKPNYSNDLPTRQKRMCMDEAISKTSDWKMI